MINKLLGEPYLDLLIKELYCDSLEDSDDIISLKSIDLRGSFIQCLNRKSKKIAFCETLLYSDKRKIKIATLEETVAIFKGQESKIETYILDNLYMFDQLIGHPPHLFVAAHWKEWCMISNQEKYQRLGVPNDGNLLNLLPLWYKR